jgi:hypothetical protein
MVRVVAIAYLTTVAAASGGTLRSQPVTGVCSDPAAQESGYYDIADGTKQCATPLRANNHAPPKHK